jgi:hypothetical protein
VLIGKGGGSGGGVEFRKEIPSFLYSSLNPSLPLLYLYLKFMYCYCYVYVFLLHVYVWLP